MSKVGVLLSGSGFLDGAEIRESVLTLLCLDQAGVEYEIFAPNITQYHVVNHLTGEAVDESRNVLVEAARIARGNILDIKEVDPTSYSALFIPGGYGVAKNFSNFAFEGCSAEVEPNVKSFLYAYRELKRPIGGICISPALISLVYGDTGVSLTIGNDAQTAEQLELLGVKHIDCEVTKCITDKENKIVTTAAYMYDSARLSEVFQGIESCVKATLELI